MSIKNGLTRKRDEDWRKYAKAVREGLRDFVKTGTALGMLRVDDHHKEQGYASFEELVEAEFDMPKSTAYRLIEAARVVTVLSQLGTIQSKITNQAQALALSPIRKDGAALLAVIESAEASGRITAASLEAARVELYPHAKVIDGEIVPEKPALVRGIVKAIERAAETKVRCELCSKPLSDDEIGNGFTRCGACDPNGGHTAEPLDGGLWGDCLMCKTETSGAVPPASTEDASLALGEPDVDEQAASTSGTQDSPAADSLPPQAHAGVPAVGGPIEERTEERQRPWDVVWTSVGNDAEIDRQTFGSYQLALAEMERSRRAGSIAEVDVEPTPTDSPTGLEAAQPRDDRSETDSSAGPDQQDLRSDRAPEVPAVAPTVLPGIDHHDGAGVSLSGEALPVESRPAGALLEDGGTAQDPPSSSDPVVIRASVEDMIGTVERLEVPREEWDSWTPAQRRAHIDNFGAEVMNNCGGYGAGIESGAPVSDLDDEEPIEPPPGDRLMLAFATLIHYVGEVDTDAVGPLLAGDDLHTLDEHVEELAAFVRRIRKARFVEARTP